MTNFPPSGWQALRTAYERWWAGSLGRPAAVFGNL